MSKGQQEGKLKIMIYQIEQYDVKAIVNNAKGLIKATDGAISPESAMICAIQYDRLTHIYNELERITKLLTPSEQVEKEKLLKNISQKGTI